MNCPVCTTALSVVYRGGIEIDTCPRCRGVWLDRGELDKLIESAADYYANRRGDDDSDHGEYRKHDSDDRYPAYGRGQQPPYPPSGHRAPQKKGFLGKLFGFD